MNLDADGMKRLRNTLRRDAKERGPMCGGIRSFTVPVEVFDKRPCWFYETISRLDGVTRIKFRSSFFYRDRKLYVRFDREPPKRAGVYPK